MIVLKENGSLKRIVDDEGQLVANAAGNTLSVEKSYHHLFGFTIQRNVKTRQVNFSTNVINYVLSMYLNF